MPDTASGPWRQVLRLLRSGLFVVFLALVTPPFSLLALLVSWLPQSWRYHVIGQWNFAVIWVARWVCGIRYELKGAENLPPPPYVVCAKHQSAWETLSMYVLLPRNCFVVKRSLLLIPFFGWGMLLCMSPIPIDRKDPAAALRKIIRTGTRRLATGWNVIIFPEGTRTPVGMQRPFMPSASMLAAHAKVPMVPLALNSGRFWPSSHLGFFKNPGTITVSIGKPIATQGRKTREINAEAESWINAETDLLGG